MKIFVHEDDEYPALVRLLKGVEEEPGDDRVLDKFLRRLRAKYQYSLRTKGSQSDPHTD